MLHCAGTMLVSGPGSTWSRPTPTPPSRSAATPLGTLSASATTWVKISLSLIKGRGINYSRSGYETEKFLFKHQHFYGCTGCWFWRISDWSVTGIPLLYCTLFFSVKSWDAPYGYPALFFPVSGRRTDVFSRISCKLCSYVVINRGKNFLVCRLENERFLTSVWNTSGRTSSLF